MTLFSLLSATVSDMTRTGHKRALETGLAPETRVTALASFTWSACHVPNGALILPDCVALAIGQDGVAIDPYILSGFDEVEQVLLPISPKQLLIGCRPNTKPASIEDFNRAAASCCVTFFVSCQRSEELESLAELIGSRSKTSVLNLVSDAVAQLRSRSVTTSTSGEITLRADVAAEATSPGCVGQEDGSQAPESLLSYPVSFLNCADQETAEQIAIAVDVVVREMARSMPLHRLASVVFAEDYGKALRELDRGFSGSRPLEPTEEDFGSSVAMSPLVLRDGRVKASIVMQSWLGHALIAHEHGDAQAAAIHTLAGMLANVAFVELFDEALPGVLFTRMDDGWNALLFEHIDAALTAYFSARSSAGIWPDIGPRYRDMLLTVLDRARELIPRERLAYRYHGNLDDFLKLATTTIGKVLTHTARLLGHYDGVNELFYDEGGRLRSAFDKMGLVGWVDVYQRDLRTLFGRRRVWSSLREFTALNIHMERMLWQFAIFPWRDEAGQVRVEIPLAADATKLLEMPPHQESQTPSSNG